MPRCFCGEELENSQHDMCSACKEAVDETLDEFEEPEGVLARPVKPLGLGGVVMPLEKAPLVGDDE